MWTFAANAVKFRRGLLRARDELSSLHLRQSTVTSTVDIRTRSTWMLQPSAPLSPHLPLITLQPQTVIHCASFPRDGSLKRCHNVPGVQQRLRLSSRKRKTTATENGEPLRSIVAYASADFSIPPFSVHFSPIILEGSSPTPSASLSLLLVSLLSSLQSISSFLSKQNHQRLRNWCCGKRVAPHISARSHLSLLEEF